MWLLHYLTSDLCFYSWILLFIGATVHWTLRYRYYGIAISAALLVGIAFFIYLIISWDPYARGGAGTIGPAAAQGFYILGAVGIILIATLIANLSGFDLSLKSIKKWHANKGKFPFFMAFPFLSLVVFCLFLMFSIFHAAFLGMIKSEIVKDNCLFVRMIVHGKKLVNATFYEEPYHPLHVAAWYGRYNIVDCLIKKGADINAFNNDNIKPPLWMFLGRDFSGQNFLVLNTPIKCMLEEFAGSERNFTLSHTKCAISLIKNGAFMEEDVIEDLFKLPNPDEIMAALYDRVRNRSGYEKTILGISVDSARRIEVRGFFEMALKHKYNRLFQKYLENGGDMNTIFPYNRNLLAVAFEMGNSEMGEYLINRGIDCSFNTNTDQVLLPLHMIGHVDSSVAGHYLSIIGNNNIDFPWCLHTALNDAVEEQNIPVARLLLRKGSNPNYYPHNGEPPIFEAARNGNSKIVKLLCTYGADPDGARARDSRTPLIELCLDDSEHVDCAKALLDCGASLNASEEGVGTALNAAEYRNHQNLVKLLTSYRMK